MKKSHGFTLLELIVTLVLVGILSTVAGAGFVSATKGYLFTKNVTVGTQNGQATMARLGKMLINLTDITRTSDNAFKVTYKRNDIDITEEISLVKDSSAKTGRLQTVHSGSTNPKIPEGTYTLQDHVSDFVVRYYVADTWFNAPPIGDLRGLALIRVQLKMDIDGTPLEFACDFIPRNVFNAPQHFDPSGGYTEFGSSPNCFVATATYGTPNNPVVLLLRKFRDKYLLSWAGGRKIVAYYYTYGPLAADMIRGNDTLITLSKLVLLPAAGFAYLILLHPLGLLCIPLVFFLGRKMARSYLPELRNNVSGGIIIGIIGAMLFMSLLSSAMLHMYGSTAFATVGYSLSPKAYYLAESGLRHAGKVYAEEIKKENGTPSSAVRALHNKTFSLPSKVGANTSSSEKIHYNIATYWFEGPSPSTGVEVKSLIFEKNVLGALPPIVCGKKKKGYLYLKTSQQTVAYTNVKEDDRGITFHLNKAVTVQDREDILFAGLVDKVDEQNFLAVGANISIGSAISFFPPTGGIVRIDNGTQEKYAMYARANYKDGVLEGLTEIPGQAKFGTSFKVHPKTTTVILQYYARITSTGSVGSTNEPVTRTITQSQPLFMVTNLVRRTFTDAFDDKDQSSANWKNILDEESGVRIEDQKDNDGEENYALASSGGTVIHNSSSYEVESLTNLTHENQALKDMLKWHDAGAGDDNLLFYDVQVKIKFNERDDVAHEKFYGLPISEDYTRGTWMHGLAFQIKPTNTNKLTTTYGLSLLSTFRGPPKDDPYYWDGISDELLDDHDDNNITWDSYSDHHFWDDSPMYSGIPHLVFWERMLESTRYLAKYPLADMTPAAFAVYKRKSSDVQHGPEYIIHVFFGEDAIGQAQTAYDKNYTYKNGRWKVTKGHKWYTIPYRTREGHSSVVCNNYRPADSSPYVGYAISPKYNILNRTYLPNGEWVVGSPRHEAFITDADGNLPPKKGYVIEASTEPNGSNPDVNILSAMHSYRFWIQDWTTLHASIAEFTAKDSFYKKNLGSDKVVVISAAFATPDGNDISTGDVKVVGRAAYPRSSQGELNIKWIDDGDYFKLVKWEDEKNDKNESIWDKASRFKNYSSQKRTKDSLLAELLSSDPDKKFESDKKSVFPGLDNEKDYVYALTGSFSLPNEIGASAPHHLANMEVGLHSMGIGDFGDDKSENVYFDDFAIRVYQLEPQGLMRGIQQEN